jgi:pimeloyl-ACP methyl ester carboxylesterase
MQDDGFIEHFCPAEDGLMLYARDYGVSAPAGKKQRTPLICLPGLSRNSRDFHQLALLLSQHSSAPRRVIALDYRGRGRSGRDETPANYNLVVECRDVLTICAALGLERCLFAGTSRGGLILHLLAAAHPQRIAGVILNDIGPEIEAAGLAEIRTYLSRVVPLSTFDEAARALKILHGEAFPALGPLDWKDMAEAIYVKKDGGIVADFDPALTEQLKTMDLEKPLPTLWPQFGALARSPLLVIRGEHSRILSRSTFEAMSKAAPAVWAITAHGQGHAPLLHHPDIFPAIVEFLQRY